MKPRAFPLSPAARAAAIAALLAGLAAPGLASAQSTGGDPKWSQLSPAQQTALSPLRNDWDRLDPSGKQKWVEVAGRFNTMAPYQRERVQERMNEWAKLSPNQRTEARINYQQSKQVPQADRQARWEAYQALPAEERAALAARAAKPSPVASTRSPERQSLREAPVDTVVPKSNLVAPNARNGNNPPPLKPVAPSVVQGMPGATTSLVTATPKPPPHQKPGQPKIMATPKQVDKTTLLPKQGGASNPPPGKGGGGGGNNRPGQ